MFPPASTANFEEVGFPEDKSISLYPAVRVDPKPEIKLPEIIFCPVMFKSPEPVELRKPSRFKLILPVPSGEIFIEPFVPSVVISCRLLPSRLNIPDDYFKAGLAAAMSRCPLLSMKGIVEIPAGDCGGRPCNDSEFKANPTEAIWERGCISLSLPTVTPRNAFVFSVKTDAGISLPHVDPITE